MAPKHSPAPAQIPEMSVGTSWGRAGRVRVVVITGTGGSWGVARQEASSWAHFLMALCPVQELVRGAASSPGSPREGQLVSSRPPSPSKPSVRPSGGTESGGHQVPLPLSPWPRPAKATKATRAGCWSGQDPRARGWAERVPQTRFLWWTRGSRRPLSSVAIRSPRAPEREQKIRKATCCSLHYDHQCPVVPGKGATYP